MASNPAQAGQAFPLNFEEIEGLVKSLYDPGNAKKISQNEATLRVLQRSPQGWEIADALLKSSDEQVRFFGALTLTVKLNADSCVPGKLKDWRIRLIDNSNELTEEHSQQLLVTLVVCYVCCQIQVDQAYVFRIT